MSTYAIRCSVTCECGRTQSWIKLGTAEDVFQRRRELQTGCPIRLEIVATCDGSYDEEHALHATHREDRVRGEWFYPTEAVMQTVASLHQFKRKDWQAPPMVALPDTQRSLREERAAMARSR